MHLHPAPENLTVKSYDGCAEYGVMVDTPTGERHHLVGRRQCVSTNGFYPWFTIARETIAIL